MSILSKQVLLIVLLFLNLFFLHSCNSRTYVQIPNDAALLHLLNERLTNVITQDGFSPPVASRIYAYSNVTSYQIFCANTQGYPQLSGRLHGLSNLSRPSSFTKIDKRIVLIYAFSNVANSIVYRDSILTNLRDSLLMIYMGHIDDSVIVNSQNYAEVLSKEIISWSEKDGYSQTRKMPIYKPSSALMCWQPTPPKYADAIEPYWGVQRPFAIDSSSWESKQFEVPFDTNPGSLFYAMMKEVYDTTAHLDSIKIMIAHFWDDNPLIILSKGHTMLNYRQIGPPGHWINIAAILCRKRMLTADQSADVYLRTSLALADAFIACWQNKYKYCTMRPVTYINRYIDPNWKPIIETPPFPEFTCGHSTISAAAAQVLADYFGDSITFIDNTNDPYNLPVRTFTSILDASEEAGKSRIYGGIHIRYSCIKGREQGLKIGHYITLCLTKGKDRI
ncbi:MAG: vanadium-dependent haloperoxidase [Chitinophagales bacterium]